MKDAGLRGVAEVGPEAPAAVLMVDLRGRRVLYANDVARQMAPGLSLPVGVEEWSATADLRDLDGEPIDETGHPLSRVARFEPVAGQGVSAARSSDLGPQRQPLWVVGLPLDDAPNLRGYALVVFLPVHDREALQDRAEAAHARAADTAVGAAGAVGSELSVRDASAVREAAVLATGLSFTVADARDPDLALVWVNPAFTAVTGYTFERAVGHNCRFLQGPGSDPDVTQRMREALRTGASTTETLLNYRADGTAFWNQVAMSPILDADGAVTHYVGIQSDVSGRVAADAERDRALDAEREARAAAEVAQGRAQLAQADAEAAHARLQLLAEVTRQLSETVDPEEALDRLAHLVVPAVADFAVLAYVRDDAAVATPQQVAAAAGSPRAQRHGLQDVAWWHHDPALREVLGTHARHRLRELSARGREGLVTLLGPEGRSVIATRPSGPRAVEQVDGVFDDGAARDSLRALAPTSVATFSLRSRGRTLGLLTLGTGAGRAPLDDDDLALGADIATRAGLALDRSRLFRQQRDLAEGLQHSLLDLSSTSAPAFLQVAVRYVAAAEAAQVGGDFYDLFSQPSGSAVAVIGDVMGHDTQAAAAMAQLRSIVRTLGVVGDDGPARILTRADEVTRALGVETTATGAVVRLVRPDERPTGACSGVAGTDDEDVDDGSVVLEWSNAGHPPPLVVLPSGGVETLSAPRTDLLLGIDPTTRRQQLTTSLPAGAVLLMYTDGLVERRDQPLLVGIERLRAVADAAARRGDDLEAMVDAVLAEMLPPLPSDDVAVLAVRRR